MQSKAKMLFFIWQLLLIILVGCTDEVVEATALTVGAIPTTLSTPLSRTYCVTSARIEQRERKGPASFLVVYGQTRRYRAQFNSIVLAQVIGIRQSSLVHSMQTENTTTVLENVILIYDGDTLELQQEAVDENPVVESCTTEDGTSEQGGCDLQCAAHVDEYSIVLSVLGPTEVREYRIFEGEGSLTSSIQVSNIVTPRLRMPKLVFNPFRGKNVLYYASNDLEKVVSWVTECSFSVCFHFEDEYILSRRDFPLFVTDSVIADFELIGNPDDGNLVLTVLMQNALVFIKDLSELGDHSMHSRLPYKFLPSIRPAFARLRNNITWAFVSDGRASFGSRLVPLRLGTQWYTGEQISPNIPWLPREERQVPLSTIQQGERYIIVIAPVSELWLELDGKRYEPTFLSKIRVQKVRTYLVYSFTPLITGNYTLAASDSFWFIAYYNAILVPEFNNVGERELALCCTLSKLKTIDAVQLQRDEARLLTTSGNGTVHIWNPQSERPLESFLTPSVDKDLNFVSYSSMYNGKRLITFSPSSSAFQVWSVAEPAQPRYTDGFLLVFNVTVYFAAAMFVRFIIRSLPRYKEKLFMEKKGAPSRLRKILTYIGYRRSFRVFDVVSLRDYILRPTKLHLTTRVGKVQIGPNKLLLTAYLLFVLSIFSSSADIFASLSSATSSNQCMIPENKLNAVKQEAMKELNYFGALEMIQEAKTTASNLEQSIIRVKRQSNGNYFRDWRSGLKDVCDAQAREEFKKAQAALTSKCDARVSCENAFVKLDLSLWRLIEWFFVRDFDNLVIDEEICIPAPGTKVPCPIDTSVIKDLFALQQLLDGQQSAPIAPLTQSANFAEQQVMKELNKLLWLISLGSQIYIAYAVLRIYAVIPLNLYHSSLLNSIKRRFFAMSQLTFVFWVVLAIWMVPYLVTTLSFENLYLYLHNVNADPCYMLPNFLTQVGKQIIDACDEVDTLEKQYFAVQWETRDLNLTANKYRDCEIGTKPGYATLPIFDNLDSAAEVLNGSYPASTCNQKTMIELAAKFSRAPGEKELDFIGFFYVIGLILQLCPGFLFARFGLSFIRTMDPLLLHDGCIEIERRKDMVEEARKDIYQAKKRAKVEFLIKQKSDVLNIRGQQNGKLDEARLRKLEIETTGTGNKELLALCDEEIEQEMKAVKEKIDEKKKQREEELAEKLMEIQEREVEMIEFGEQANQKMLTKIKLGLLEAQIISDFLYYQRLPSFIFNGVLVYIYFASVFRRIVDPKSADSAVGDLVIVLPAILGFVAWVATKLYHKYSPWRERGILDERPNNPEREV